MLSRRLIRVKVFKVLFSKVASGSDSLIGAENELIASCEKTRDLYIFLLNLPIALKKTAQIKIDGGLKKFHPTQEEASPNLKFVQNSFIEILENDADFLKAVEVKGLNWNEYDSFLKKLFASISQSEYFKAYMESGESSLEEDTKLIKDIFTYSLEDNLDLEEILEDLSIFWMNDLEYVLNKIIANIDKYSKKKKINLPDTFLQSEDLDYAKKLLSKSMMNYDEYTEIVSSMVPNWDLERLVATDLALIVMGITEAVNFDSIPLKVTINEFVDISKYYSTPNSKVFVNGILDKVLVQMQNDGKIQKKGRGLVGTLANSNKND